MRNRLSPRLTALLSVAAAASTAAAASHRDWTVVPLGSFPLHEGRQTIHVAHPFDRFGLIASPIAFTVFFDPSQPLTQPVEIRLAHDDQQLPPWTVERLGQTYVIGRATLERAALWPPLTTQPAMDPTRVLTLCVTVKNAADGLALMASGAPDLRLAGDGALGPLEQVITQLARGPAREYLSATVSITTGRLQMARADFARLAQGPDALVARFARAALRRIRFAEAEARLEPGFNAHYRLGLYAQQCGMSRAARLHFEAAVLSLETTEARPTAWRVSDAWFRLGETMERCGEPVADVAAVMERAGQEAGVTPNEWDVWVTILKSNEYEERHDGGTVPVRVQMTSQQIERIRREWGWVTQMVYGASGGHLKLNTRFVEIPDTSAVAYGLNAGWLYGPLDELLPIRGSVDCLMSFHPRGPSATGGADCGPNGAALSNMGTWCGWEVYLHEWNHQFDWTLRAAEAGDGYPITHHSDGCGHQPIPSMGYGHRASMHYYVTPAMYQRLEPADPDSGEGYIRQWNIFEGIVFSPDIPAGQDVPRHKAAALPPSQHQDAPRRFLNSPTNFIDLIEFLGDRWHPQNAHRVTFATAHVLAPQRQEVRLWLGHNDGMALWLNNELIHRGDYYASAKFEDHNLPNMVATSAVLRKGWNRIDVAVESWPAPRNRGFGFSVRICDFDNQLVPGLTVADARVDVPQTIAPDPFRPNAGKYYRWDEVRDDFCHRLPKLDARALAQHAGLTASFDVVGSIGATHGFVALGRRPVASNEPSTNHTTPDEAHLDLPTSWNRDQDHDTRLNNLLDWNREAVAVYPFATGDQPLRHYLLIRPEAVAAYLTCLQEPPEAQDLFGGRPVRDRILGYVQVGRMDGEAEGVRVLIVAEACLPTPLPADEEDLLAPLAQ